MKVYNQYIIPRIKPGCTGCIQKHLENHIFYGGNVSGKYNAVHAKCFSGGNVVCPVVDEETFCRVQMIGIEQVVVNLWLWFCCPNDTGKYDAVKFFCNFIKAGIFRKVD